MKTLALAGVLMLATSSSALAGGAFVGLGLGTGSDLGDARMAPGGRSLRLEGGYGVQVGPGRLAIEGLYQGFDVNTSFVGPMSARSLGIAGRYNLLLGSGFEAYGRLGVQQLSVTGNQRATYDATGRGPLLGGGFELRPGLGLDLSLWVDLTYAKASLAGDHFMSDAAAHFFTAGVSVGF